MCTLGDNDVSHLIAANVPLVQDVDRGRAVAGEGAYGKSLYLLLNIALNPKLL